MCWRLRSCLKVRCAVEGAKYIRVMFAEITRILKPSDCGLATQMALDVGRHDDVFLVCVSESVRRFNGLL